MRVSEIITNDPDLFIDECGTTFSLPKNHHHSSIQSHTPEEEPIPYSSDNKSSSKDLRNKFIEKNRSFKRASWSPSVQQECGLPPTGKKTDGDQSTINKNLNRVRMRSKSIKNYQLQHPNQLSIERPVSFNEKYDRLAIQSLVRLFDRYKPNFFMLI